MSTAPAVAEPPPEPSPASASSAGNNGYGPGYTLGNGQEDGVMGGALSALGGARPGIKLRMSDWVTGKCAQSVGGWVNEVVELQASARNTKSAGDVDSQASMDELIWGMPAERVSEQAGDSPGARPLPPSQEGSENSALWLQCKGSSGSGEPPVGSASQGGGGSESQGSDAYKNVFEDWSRAQVPGGIVGKSQSAPVLNVSGGAQHRASVLRQGALDAQRTAHAHEMGRLEEENLELAETVAKVKESAIESIKRVEAGIEARLEQHKRELAQENQLRLSGILSKMAAIRGTTVGELEMELATQPLPGFESIDVNDHGDYHDDEFGTPAGQLESVSRVESSGDEGPFISNRAKLAARRAKEAAEDKLSKKQRREYAPVISDKLARDMWNSASDSMRVAKQRGTQGSGASRHSDPGASELRHQWDVNANRLEIDNADVLGVLCASDLGERRNVRPEQMPDMGHPLGNGDNHRPDAWRVEEYVVNSDKDVGNDTSGSESSGSSYGDEYQPCIEAEESAAGMKLRSVRKLNHRKKIEQKDDTASSGESIDVTLGSGSSDKDKSEGTEMGSFVCSDSSGANLPERHEGREINLRSEIEQVKSSIGSSIKSHDVEDEGRAKSVSPLKWVRRSGPPTHPNPVVQKELFVAPADNHEEDNDGIAQPGDVIEDEHRVSAAVRVVVAGLVMADIIPQWVANNVLKGRGFSDLPRNGMQAVAKAAGLKAIGRTVIICARLTGHYMDDDTSSENDLRHADDPENPVQHSQPEPVVNEQPQTVKPVPRPTDLLVKANYPLPEKDHVRMQQIGEVLLPIVRQDRLFEGLANRVANECYGAGVGQIKGVEITWQSVMDSMAEKVVGMILVEKANNTEYLEYLCVDNIARQQQVQVCMGQLSQVRDEQGNLQFSLENPEHGMPDLVADGISTVKKVQTPCAPRLELESTPGFIPKTPGWNKVNPGKGAVCVHGSAIKPRIGGIFMPDCAECLKAVCMSMCPHGFLITNEVNGKMAAGCYSCMSANFVSDDPSVANDNNGQSDQNDGDQIPSSAMELARQSSPQAGRGINQTVAGQMVALRNRNNDDPDPDGDSSSSSSSDSGAGGGGDGKKPPKRSKELTPSQAEAASALALLVGSDTVPDLKGAIDGDEQQLKFELIAKQLDKRAGTLLSVDALTMIQNEVVEEATIRDLEAAQDDGTEGTAFERFKAKLIAQKQEAAEAAAVIQAGGQRAGDNVTLAEIKAGMESEMKQHEATRKRQNKHILDAIALAFTVEAEQVHKQSTMGNSKKGSYNLPRNVASSQPSRVTGEELIKVTQMFFGNHIITAYSLYPPVRRFMACKDMDKRWTVTLARDIAKKDSMYYGQKNLQKVYITQAASLYDVLWRDFQKAVQSALGEQWIDSPNEKHRYKLEGVEGDGPSILNVWMATLFRYDTHDIDHLKIMVERLPAQLSNGKIRYLVENDRALIDRANKMGIKISWAMGISKMCRALQTLENLSIGLMAQKWMTVQSAIVNDLIRESERETMSLNSVPKYNTFLAELLYTIDTSAPGKLRDRSGSDMKTRQGRLLYIMHRKLLLGEVEDIEELEPEAEEGQINAMSGRQGGGDKPPGACFKCGDPSHTSRDCKSKKELRECWNCGSVGHLGRDCKSQKENKSTKSSTIKCCVCSGGIPEQMVERMRWKSGDSKQHKCGRCFYKGFKDGVVTSTKGKRMYTMTKKGKGKKLSTEARAFIASGLCEYTEEAIVKMSSAAKDKLDSSGKLKKEKKKGKGGEELTLQAMQDEIHKLQATMIQKTDEDQDVEDLEDAAAASARVDVVRGTEAESSRVDFAASYRNAVGNVRLMRGTESLGNSVDVPQTCWQGHPCKLTKPCCGEGSDRFNCEMCGTAMRGIRWACAENPACDFDICEWCACETWLRDEHKEMARQSPDLKFMINPWEGGLEITWKLKAGIRVPWQAQGGEEIPEEVIEAMVDYPEIVSPVDFGAFETGSEVEVEDLPNLFLNDMADMEDDAPGLESSGSESGESWTDDEITCDLVCEESMPPESEPSRYAGFTLATGTTISGVTGRITGSEYVDTGSNVGRMFLTGSSLHREDPINVGSDESHGMHFPHISEAMHRVRRDLGANIAAEWECGSYRVTPSFMLRWDTAQAEQIYLNPLISGARPMEADTFLLVRATVEADMKQQTYSEYVGEWIATERTTEGRLFRSPRARGAIGTANGMPPGSAEEERILQGESGAKEVMDHAYTRFSDHLMMIIKRQGVVRLDGPYRLLVMGPVVSATRDLVEAEIRQATLAGLWTDQDISVESGIMAVQSSGGGRFDTNHLDDYVKLTDGHRAMWIRGAGAWLTSHGFIRERGTSDRSSGDDNSEGGSGATTGQPGASYRDTARSRPSGEENGEYVFTRQMWEVHRARNSDHSGHSEGWRDHVSRMAGGERNRLCLRAVESCRSHHSMREELHRAAHLRGCMHCCCVCDMEGRSCTCGMSHETVAECEDYGCIWLLAVPTNKVRMETGKAESTGVVERSVSDRVEEAKPDYKKPAGICEAGHKKEPGMECLWCERIDIMMWNATGIRASFGRGAGALQRMENGGTNRTGIPAKLWVDLKWVDFANMQHNNIFSELMEVVLEQGGVWMDAGQLPNALTMTRTIRQRMREFVHDVHGVLCELAARALRSKYRTYNGDEVRGEMSMKQLSNWVLRAGGEWNGPGNGLLCQPYLINALHGHVGYGGRFTLAYGGEKREPVPGQPGYYSPVAEPEGEGEMLTMPVVGLCTPAICMPVFVVDVAPNYAEPAENDGAGDGEDPSNHVVQLLPSDVQPEINGGSSESEDDDLPAGDHEEDVCSVCKYEMRGYMLVKVGYSVFGGGEPSKFRIEWENSRNKCELCAEWICARCSSDACSGCGLRFCLSCVQNDTEGHPGCADSPQKCDGCGDTTYPWQFNSRECGMCARNACPKCAVELCKVCNIIMCPGCGCDMCKGPPVGVPIECVFRGAASGAGSEVTAVQPWIAALQVEPDLFVDGAVVYESNRRPNPQSERERFNVEMNHPHMLVIDRKGDLMTVWQRQQNFREENYSPGQPEYRNIPKTVLVMQEIGEQDVRDALRQVQERNCVTMLNPLAANKEKLAKRWCEHSVLKHYVSTWRASNAWQRERDMDILMRRSRGLLLKRCFIGWRVGRIAQCFRAWRNAVRLGVELIGRVHGPRPTPSKAQLGDYTRRGPVVEERAVLPLLRIRMRRDAFKTQESTWVPRLDQAVASCERAIEVADMRRVNHELRMSADEIEAMDASIVLADLGREDRELRISMDQMDASVFSVWETMILSKCMAMWKVHEFTDIASNAIACRWWRLQNLQVCFTAWAGAAALSACLRLGLCARRKQRVVRFYRFGVMRQYFQKWRSELTTGYWSPATAPPEAALAGVSLRRSMSVSFAEAASAGSASAEARWGTNVTSHDWVPGEPEGGMILSIPEGDLILSNDVQVEEDDHRVIISELLEAGQQRRQFTAIPENSWRAVTMMFIAIIVCMLFGSAMSEPGEYDGISSWVGKTDELHGGGHNYLFEAAVSTEFNVSIVEPGNYSAKLGKSEMVKEAQSLKASKIWAKPGVTSSLWSSWGNSMYWTLGPGDSAIVRRAARIKDQCAYSVIQRPIEFSPEYEFRSTEMSAQWISTVRDVILGMNAARKEKGRVLVGRGAACQADRMTSIPPDSVTWWPTGKDGVKPMYMEAIFDTGASHTCMAPSIGKYMTNKTKSNLELHGFDATGESVEAQVKGTAHMLGFNPVQGKAKRDRQGWLSIIGHTVPGLSHNLLSGAQVFEQMGNDISASHSDGCGISVDDTQTGKSHKVPMSFTTAAKAWIMQSIVSPDPQACATAVREIMKRVDKGERWQWWEHTGGDLDLLTKPLQEGTAPCMPSRSRSMSVSSDAPAPEPQVQPDQSSKFPLRETQEGYFSMPSIPEDEAGTESAVEASAGTGGEEAGGAKQKPKEHSKALKHVNAIEVGRMCRKSSKCGCTDSEFCLGCGVNDGESTAEYADIIAQLEKDFSVDIMATKCNMKGQGANMKWLAAHKWLGHGGPATYNGMTCKQCKALGQRPGSVRKYVDPMIQRRPGYEFAADLLTVSTPSAAGSNYALICRCTSSAFYMPPMFLEFKWQATRAMEQCIIALRSNPEYQDLGYPICRRLLCDHGGEFTGHKFKEMAQELQFTIIHNSPETKLGAAHQEVAVKALTNMTKSIMLENCLPTDMWEEAMCSAANISNLCVTAKEVKTKDGDGANPLTTITAGNISNRMAKQYLKACVRVGSPCLVYDSKVRGSNLSHTRLGFMVAVGSDRTMTLFKDPECGTIVRSRSFIEWDLQEHENYLTFFDKPQRKTNTAGMHVQKEATPKDRIMVVKGLNETMKSVVPKSGGYTTAHAINAPMPTTFVVDQGDGQAWVMGNAGNLEKMKMQIHGDMPPGEDGDVRVITKQPDRWMSTPDSDSRDYAKVQLLSEEGAKTFVGRTLYKRFYTHGKPRRILGDFLGVIKEVQCKPGQGRVWKVEYEDGDTELMCAEEVLHHAIDGIVTWWGEPKEDEVRYGSRSRLAAAGQILGAPVDEGDTDYDFDDGPYAGVSRAELKSIDIWSKRETWWSISEIATWGGTVYSTVEGDTYNMVCDKVGVAADEREIYLNWCGVGFGRNATKGERGTITSKFLAPWEQGGRKSTKLREGLLFPVAQGASWTQFTNTLRRERKYDATLDVQAVQREDARAFCAIHKYHNDKVHKLNGDDLITLNTMDRDHDGEPSTWRGMAEKAVGRAFNVTPKAYRDYFGDKVSPAEIAMITDPETGLIRNPSSLKEAYARKDGPEWRKAHETEWGTILKMGTFSEPMTLEEVRKRGITNRPITLSTLLDYKRGASGQLLKAKVRVVLAAHSGVCQKGHEYYMTFSSSPTCATERILQYLVVDQGYHRLSSDIKCAYLHGTLREEERVCVKMDADHREVNADGVETYRILKGALYGFPASERRYMEEVKKFLKGPLFNNSEWRSWTTRSDASLWCFERRLPNGKKGNEGVRRMYMSIFTDDCSIVSQFKEDGKYLDDALDKRFGTKKANPEELLGLVRRLEEDGKSMNINMSGYIESQFEKYKKHYKTARVPKTPFPPNKFLSKLDRDVNGIEKFPEYGSLVGALLWIMRMAHPECGIGVHFLCRVMAGPNEDAWKCALHMLAYLYHNRDCGIKLTAQPGGELYAFVDASAKQDHGDRGKCAAGYTIFLGSSPMDWRVTKTKYSAQSTQHAEYMAVGDCAKAVVWMRQLLEEMGQSVYTPGPTVIRCDNVAAIALVRDDITSVGNRFYTLDCHYPKEQYEKGTICVRHIEGVQNCADLMTKAVDGTTFSRLIGWLKGCAGLLPEKPPPPKT